MEFYTTRRMSEHCFSITDITQVHCYMVVGNERALLIDTGCGIGDLKSYLSSAFPLPFCVVGTHGHLDHIGGAGQFGKVYLHKADWALANENESVEKRMEYAEYILGKTAEKIKKSDYISTRALYEELREEQIFDLGGIHVRFLPLPGHTQGMMTALIQEERTLILGDACNPKVFLFSEEASTVAGYRAALSTFLNKYGKLFDNVYMSHGEECYTREVIQSCIDLCGEILKGEDDKVPVDFMGSTGYLGKRERRPGERADGRPGNIFYGENKLPERGKNEENIP